MKAPWKLHIFITKKVVSSWGGVRLSPPGTQPLFLLMSVEQSVELSGRGNRSTWRKPAPVLLCPLHIPHYLTWSRIRAAAMGSRRLTAWAYGGGHYFPETILENRQTTSQMVLRSHYAFKADYLKLDLSRQPLDYCITEHLRRIIINSYQLIIYVNYNNII
jgi:hypothetical protein